MVKLEEQIAHLPDVPTWGVYGLENLPESVLPFEVGVISVKRTGIIAFVIGKSEGWDGSMYLVYSRRILNGSDEVSRQDIKYMNADLVTNYQGTGLVFNRFK